MKKTALLVTLIILLLVLASCSSGGNDVSRAYDKALNEMKQENYQAAVETLADIPFYLDSTDLSLYCRAYQKAAEGDYDYAIEELRRLGAYRDSYKSADYFEARRAEAEASTPWRRVHAAELYERESINGYRDASARAASIRQTLYQEGVSAQEAEMWNDAASCFGALGNYQDSHTRYCYASGRVNEADGEKNAVSYATAVICYDGAGNYLDSAERQAACLSSALEEGDRLLSAGKLKEAKEIYLELDRHCDEARLNKLQEAKAAAEEAERQARLAKADALVEEGQFDEAEKIYRELGDYCDEERLTKLHEARNAAEEAERQELLAKADALVGEGQFDEAEKIYLELGDYCGKDRLTRLEEARAEAARQARIAEADQLLADGKYDEAKDIYLEVEEPDMANEAMYRKAAYLVENGREQKGAALYLEISGYKDSRDRHYAIGKSLKVKNPELSSRILLADKAYPGAEEDLYEIASAASQAENYELSVSIFSALQGKKDCTLRLVNDLYLYGQQLLDGGSPDKAANIFTQLDNVGASELYKNMARYAAAEKLESDGKYEAAAKAFDVIRDYSDARERAAECRYSLALQKKEQGQYQEAAELFDGLDDRRDSRAQATECRYLQAGEYEKKSLWEEAIALYQSLGEYADSRERRAVCFQQLGNRQLADGQAEKAYASFTSAEDTDGQARAAFAVGEAELAEANLEAALKWYQLASGLPETEERTSAAARMLLNMDEDELAERYASVVEHSEASHAVLYELALRSLERKDEEAAMRQLKKAGNSADASARYQEMLNTRVEALVSQEKYDDAIYLCSTYGDQEKADQIRAMKAQKEEEERLRAEAEAEARHKARVEEANGLLKEGKFDSAAAIFTEIGETELAAQAMAEKEAAEEKVRAEQEAARAEAERAEKERIQARENEAATLLENGQFDEAMAIYQELNEPDMVSETIYQKALTLNQPDLFLQIADYRDSREQHYLAGRALLDSDPEKAWTILSADMTYSDVPDVLYDLADRESASGNYRLSSTIFEELSRQPLDLKGTRSDCAMRHVLDLYQYGLVLKNGKEWEAAADIFESLKGVGESEKHAIECRYAVAAGLEESERYSQAAVAFEALGDYSDSNDRAVRCRYSAADQLMAAGYLENARTAFESIGTYRDASDKAKECRYQIALELMESGKFEEARQTFGALNDYSDAQAQEIECIYQIACGYMKRDQYAKVIETGRQIQDYRDMAEILATCHSRIGEQTIEKADALLQSGKTGQAEAEYRTAYNEYTLASNPEKCESLALIIADCQYSMGNTDVAVEWYLKAGVTGKQKIVRIAQYAYTTEQYELSETLAVKADSDEGREHLYHMAEDSLSSGNEEAALRLFGEAGDMLDARYQHDTIIYQMAGLSEENRDYITAISLYDEIPDYEGVAERKKANQYVLAATADLASVQDEKARQIVKDAVLAYADYLIEEEEFDKAIALLSNGNGDRDIAAMAETARTLKLKADYNTALVRRENGQYDEARAMFSSLGQYEDSATQILATWYAEGEFKREQQDWNGAVEAFAQAGSYSDAAVQIQETYYQEAAALYRAGKYVEAYEAYARIIGYRDVDSILETDANMAAARTEAMYGLFKITGSYVTFGRYPQTEKGNDRTPIEWIVLDYDAKNNRALLISRYVLDAKSYNNNSNGNSTWEKSTLRTWLNRDFLNKAFTSQEQAAILTTRVNNSRSQGYKWGPNGGNNTQDKIFLLSYAEMQKYLSVNSFKAQIAPTAYAVKQKAYTSRDYKTAEGLSASWWWLRSPGSYEGSVAYVYSNGSLNSGVGKNSAGGVCPALWINLESDFFNP